jgi:hypothetical protein
MLQSAGTQCLYLGSASLQVLFMSFAFGGIPAVSGLACSIALRNTHHGMLLGSVLVVLIAKNFPFHHPGSHLHGSHLHGSLPFHHLVCWLMDFCCRTMYLQYEGRSLAAAHAPLVRNKGLNLTHFDAVSTDTMLLMWTEVQHVSVPMSSCVLGWAVLKAASLY